MRFLWGVAVVACLTLLCGLPAAKTFDIDDCTVDALQTILDEIGVDGVVKAEKVIPLYRKDLPPDYVAYYEVLYKKEYYIIRSEKKTGDYELISRGEKPQPTWQVRNAARKRGAECDKYYVMTTYGDLMCANKEGKIVASSIPDETLLTGVKVNSKRDVENETVDISTFDSFINSKSSQQEEIWRDHAEKALMKEKEDNEEAEDGKRSTSRNVYGDYDMLEKREKDESTNQSANYESFIARPIVPGSEEKVATGRLSRSAEVRIRCVMRGDNSTTEAGLADHQKLCEVVRGCDMSTVSEQYAKLTPKHIHHHKHYVDIELVPETKKMFNKAEFIFAVDVVKKDGSLTTRYFGVMYRKQRERRGWNTKSWSKWYKWGIGSRELFPDYDQFWHGKCWVGCGPVAWAMVFAYYDRRSHYRSAYSGSTNLYRSSWDGTYGSPNTIAPYSVDTRMKNYIICLNRLLKTFCKGKAGSTYASKMDYVRSFFWWRQSGRPKIVESTSTSWLISYLKAHWPVIVLWKANSYSWHFPVATMLAYQYRYVRYCVWFICGKWKKQSNYWMWLHMGWGRYSNGKPKGNKYSRLDFTYAVAAPY